MQHILLHLLFQVDKKGTRPVFVPNTKKGDSVKIRVTKVSRRVGFAEVVA
ncbi:MAG: TRAM domain-containing protein [Methanophagales archaeon ANME-1-THS]|nr:MAG: TRAM domain-containing protein [Methanophagales archaeon ANME-1-THS]